MGGRGRAGPRRMCVNCNISIGSPTTQKGFLVLEQNTRVISLISNWISPLIIDAEDYICEACFSLAVQAVNADLHGMSDRCAGPSLHGHKEVCLICGRSLGNKQSHKILQQTSPHHSGILQLVEDRVAPREIQPSDHLCHACYVRLERNAIRNLEFDNRRIVEDMEAVQPAEQVDPEIPEIQEDHGQDPLASSDQSEAAETPETAAEQPSLPDATLRNYRRAPNTASHCIFYGCHNISSLHTVPNVLRRILLINYKYYVPKHSKVCSEHLIQNRWDCLYDSPNSMATFTIEQIEHMLSFID